jgi:D-3-phosphoglycerate dehydrogenase / 2-oxoglutarate reductase
MLPVIVLYERMHERGLKMLQAAGEVIVAQSIEEEALLPLFAKANAVVVPGMGSVTRRLLQGAPQLRVVGRHGAGVDNVDVQAATELGIWVVNTPWAPAESVAEHFLLLALSLARHLRQAERALRRGEWSARAGLTGVELQGKTLGIVGFGHTGRLIAKKCHAAFDTRALYYDPVRAEPVVERESGAQYAPLDQLLADSDFVTLQVPLTPETRHMISAEQIARMKPTAYLLNMCRGPVWDEGAVLRALVDRRIAGAATDVFEVEPPSRAGQTLLQLTNFMATPHIGGNTAEAMERMSLVAEDIVRVLNGDEPQFRVNQPRRPRVPARQ